MYTFAYQKKWPILMTFLGTIIETPVEVVKIFCKIMYINHKAFNLIYTCAVSLSEMIAISCFLSLLQFASGEIEFIFTLIKMIVITAQLAVGGECWSSSNGVAASGCGSGTQCGPWLPDGGLWDGSAPWYCLRNPALTAGATCDYSVKVFNIEVIILLTFDCFKKNGPCATGLTCCNGQCASSSSPCVASTAAPTTPGTSGE